MQWSVRLIGLVSVFILARLLTPQDFGMVGLAMAALALVELLGAVGLRQALLRVPEPQREHFDTAWTIQLILFFAIGVAAVALAPLIAAVYRQPPLTPVLIVLSLRFFALGLVNIGIVEFDRQLDFGRDLRMRVLTRLASFAATLAAALVLKTYWALVAGIVSHSVFLAVASYLAQPYRPRLCLSRRADLLGTSLWIFVAAVAQAVQMQIERLVLGRFAGPHLVGLYSVSKDLAIIFTHEIATALNRVTFVTVARGAQPLAEQPLRVARLLGAYAMIAAPIGLGLAATAEDAVALFLGPQWTGAAPYLRVVAIYSAFYAVFKVIASALQAAGHARRAAILSAAGAAGLILMVPGAALLRPDGATVALSAMASNLVILGGGIVVIARTAGVPAFALSTHVLRPFVAALAMALTVQLAGPDTGSPLLDMAGAVTIGVVAYPLALLGFWFAAGRPEGAEREMLLHLENLRSRRSARPVELEEPQWKA